MYRSNNDTSQAFAGNLAGMAQLVDWVVRVELMEVPKFQKYRFAVVNKHRLIVDAKTRKVVKMYK